MEGAIGGVTSSLASAMHGIPEPPRVSLNRDQLLYFSAAVTSLATVFWIWALKNTITQHFDLGVVTFLLAFIAALAGLVLHYKTDPRVAAWQPNFFRVASFAVSVNYFLGIFVGGFFFRVYCFIGVIVWAAIGFYGGKNYQEAWSAVVYPELV